MVVAKRWLVALGAAAILIVVALCAVAWRAERGLANAEALANLGLWSGARVELERYVGWRPKNDRAVLLLAEATIKDDLLASTDAAASALARLQSIGDDSPLAAQARLQEARVELLLLRRPGRAERALRRALMLDPNLVEAHYLLWKTLHLTGRFDRAEPQFWSVFERTVEAKRAEMLREWYMSQFFPITAIADFERTLGLLRPEEIPTIDTEARRCFVFCETEPDSPLGYAAAAHWSARSGEPQAGLQILDEGRAKLGEEPTDPFWLSAVIQCSIDVGDVARARAALDRWPAEDRGHSYWRSRAIVLDEAGEYRGALAAYDAALAIWPGQVDWRLQFRKANCLGRAGLLGEAADERAAAKVMEDLNQDPVHSRLRELMSRLDQPPALREIAEFYTKIDRPKEAHEWLTLSRQRSAASAVDGATNSQLTGPKPGVE